MTPLVLSIRRPKEVTFLIWRPLKKGVVLRRPARVCCLCRAKVSSAQPLLKAVCCFLCLYLLMTVPCQLKTLLTLVLRRPKEVACLELFGAILEPILEPSWPAWAILGSSGPSWGYLGAVLDCLGPSWAILGPILGPSWAILGPSWVLRGHLRVILELSWAVWGHPGPSWGPI